MPKDPAPNNMMEALGRIHQKLGEMEKLLRKIEDNTSEIEAGIYSGSVTLDEMNETLERVSEDTYQLAEGDDGGQDVS